MLCMLFEKTASVFFLFIMLKLHTLHGVLLTTVHCVRSILLHKTSCVSLCGECIP